jgi:hypothetical protein
MGNAGAHIIHHADVVINTRQWPDSNALQVWVKQQLLESLDNVMDEMAGDDEWVMLDKLELNVNLDSLSGAAPYEILPQLKTQLQKAFSNATNIHGSSIERQSTSERMFEGLTMYLVKGTVAGHDEILGFKNWLLDESGDLKLNESQLTLLRKIISDKNAFSRFSQLCGTEDFEKWMLKLLPQQAWNGLQFPLTWSKIIHAFELAAPQKSIAWFSVLSAAGGSLEAAIIDLFRRIAEQLPIKTFAAAMHNLPGAVQILAAENQKMFFERTSDEFSKEWETDIALLHSTIEKKVGKLGIVVSNAGLVLLAGFLPHYFDALSLHPAATKEDAKVAAMLLHYLATGKATAEDWELALPKVLCGLDLKEACPGSIELNETMMRESSELLNAVINYWERLGNTSIEGLRYNFLQRSGRLHLHESSAELFIAEKTEDILLQFVPWNFRMIKLPWMKCLLTVNWGK